MSSDNPQSAEPGELSVDSAAAVFTTLLDPPVEKEEEKVDTEIDPPVEKDVEPPEPVEEGDDAPFTIEVDGKQVTLTKEQIAEAYKNGLRQSDYTQKTMALAEQRKAAEAEAQKAFEERQTYATSLQKMAAQLEGAIQQQEKIDWNALLDSDPVEFLKQKHLYDQRQVALQKNQQEMTVLSRRAQAEQTQAHQSHLRTQQDELLAKLPEWKDESKAKSERESLKTYLQEQGYEPKDIDAISDHKAVILSRKAMLYDQMMAKASAAAKKVQNLPTKVERPGVSTERNPLDGRMKAMKRLEGSGSVEDAAALFSSLL
jgi:hypothetical protein